MGLDDGTVFSTTDGGQPVSFVLGSGASPFGIAAEIEGMRVGETKSVGLSPNQAFGPYDSKNIFKVSADQLPANSKVGSRLSNGSQMAVVTNIEDGTATIDLNHPLAGQTIHLSLTLVSSEKPQKSQLKKTTLKAGDGVHFPSKGDQLTMHYTGRLASNGQQFDSSVD